MTLTNNPEFQSLIKELEAMSFNNTQADNEDRNVFLGKHKPKARTIGEKLNELGGFEAMQLAYQTFKVKYRHDKRELELVWNGIGDWSW